MDKVPRGSLQDQAVKSFLEELRMADNQGRPESGVTKAARKGPNASRTLARTARTNILASEPIPLTAALSHKKDSVAEFDSRQSAFADSEAEENSDDYDTDLETDAATGRPKAASTGHVKAEAVWVAQYKTECRQLNVVPISQAIGQMNKKQWLLRKCSINAREMQALSRLMVLKFDLVSLDFTSSAIGPDGLRFLIAALLENRSIEEVDLTENELNSEGCSLLCTHLDVLDRVRVLNLSGNHFKPSDGERLAELVRKVVSLRTIVLSKNELGERGAEAIAEALCDNTALQTLDLSWNHIRLGGARALGHSLNENQTLKKLLIGWNGFADEAIKPLTRALEGNQGLIELDLSSNRIAVEGAFALARALERNETLQVLKLNRNLLTSRGADYILAALKKNVNSKVERVEMENVSVTYNFAAAYNDMLATRKVLIIHDKYVRFSNVGPSGQKAKEVLKVSPAELLRIFLTKRKIDITKQEFTVNRNKPNKQVQEGQQEGGNEEPMPEQESEGPRYVPEIMELAVTENPETGVSTADAAHFRALLLKLGVPLAIDQVEQLFKKVGKTGQLDVTPFLSKNLSPDFEAELNTYAPEKTML